MGKLITKLMKMIELSNNFYSRLETVGRPFRSKIDGKLHRFGKFSKHANSKSRQI